MPTPIKRSKELTPLSRDHHDGLLLCWKIKTGIKKEIPLQRIAAYTKHFFSTYIEDHFKDEEQIVFTLLKDMDIMKTVVLKQHDEIRLLAEKLDVNASVDLLNAFADSLNTHIRFEERQLFNHIENTVATDKLTEAGRQLETHHSKQIDAIWHDEFWLTK